MHTVGDLDLLVSPVVVVDVESFEIIRHVIRRF
jgi:hypothetical protein